MQAAERTLEEDWRLLCGLAKQAGDLAMSYLGNGGPEAWNKKREKPKE